VLALEQPAQAAADDVDDVLGAHLERGAQRLLGDAQREVDRVVLDRLGLTRALVAELPDRVLERGRHGREALAGLGHARLEAGLEALVLRGRADRVGLGAGLLDDVLRLLDADLGRFRRLRLGRRRDGLQRLELERGSARQLRPRRRLARGSHRPAPRACG